MRERVLEGAVIAQQVRRPLGADAFRAGQLIRGIAPERDEVGHLAGLHAVPLAHLGGTDARHLARPDRLKNGRPLRGELERVAVAGGDEGGPATPLLVGDGGGKKIVGLETWRLGVRETARGDEARQDAELIDQFGVELTAGLIGLERLVAIGRHVQGIPADQHGPRLFGLVQPQQEIDEANDRAAAQIAAPADRLRQRVIRAMRERVAVDDEKRARGRAVHRAVIIVIGGPHVQIPC